MLRRVEQSERQGDGGEMCGSGLGGRGTKRKREEGVESTKSREMSHCTAVAQMMC